MPISLPSPRSRFLAAVLVPLFTACGGGDGDPTDPGSDPAITVTVNPSSVTLEQSGEVAFTVSVSRTGGFSGAVEVNVQGLPQGVTAASASIAAAASQATLNLQAAAQAALGTTTVTIRATASGVDPAIATLELEVVEAPPGTFQLGLDPSSVVLAQGQSTTVSVSIDRSGGFQGTVELAVTGAPSGLGATFASTSVDGSATDLELTASGSLAPDDYTLTVTGTGDGAEGTSAELRVTVTTSGTGGEFAWSFCDIVPAWFAVRDGVGPWTPIDPDGDRFTFSAASDQIGVAYVEVGPLGDVDVFVYFVGPDELAPELGAPCPDTKTVHATVAGLGAMNRAFLSFPGSPAMVLPGEGATFEDVPVGPVDLIGARMLFDAGSGTESVDRLLLRRNLDPPDGGTIDADFNGTGAFAPLSRTLTLTSLNGEEALLGLRYGTSNGNGALGPTLGAPSPANTRAFAAVPSEEQETDDLHHLSAMTLSTQGTEGRRGEVYFHDPVDQQIDLGPALGATQVSVVSSDPYVRLRVQYTPQPDYNRLWLLGYDRTGGGANWSVAVTDDYLGDADLDVMAPDFSGVGGWDNAWGVEPVSEIGYSFTAMGYAHGGLLPSLAPADGLRVHSAFRGGQIAP